MHSDSYNRLLNYLDGITFDSSSLLNYPNAMENHFPDGRVAISAADCMRRKRAVLAENGFVQTKLSIPSSLHERLRALKLLNTMRSLEVVITALIRKAMADAPQAALGLPPVPPGHDPIKTIAVHIPREHYQYLERVARHLRGVNLGVALEAIAAAVTDLTPAPMQLSLIEEDLP